MVKINTIAIIISVKGKLLICENLPMRLYKLSKTNSIVILVNNEMTSKDTKTKLSGITISFNFLMGLNY